MIGAAITEAISVSIALIPIFMMLVTLFKLADFNQKSTEVVNFVSWEKALLGNQIEANSSVNAKVDAWLLSKTDKMIQSKVTSKEYADRNNIWDLHYRLGRGGGSMIYDNNLRNGLTTDILEVELKETKSKEFMELIKSGMNEIERMSENDIEIGQFGMQLTKLSLTINTAGLINDKPCFPDQSNGSVKVPKISGTLCINRNLSIISDTWVGSGPSDVASKTRSFIPIHALRPFGAKFDLIKKIPLFEPAEKLDKSIGHVEPDEIAPDRLSN